MTPRDDVFLGTNKRAGEYRNPGIGWDACTIIVRMNIRIRGQKAKLRREKVFTLDKGGKYHQERPRSDTIGGGSRRCQALTEAWIRRRYAVRVREKGSAGEERWRGNTNTETEKCNTRRGKEETVEEKTVQREYRKLVARILLGLAWNTTKGKGPTGRKRNDCRGLHPTATGKDRRG